MRTRKKRKVAFSKKAVILYFVGLAMLMTAVICMAFLSIIRDYSGSFGYLGYGFTAYSAAGAVILTSYFNKTAKENSAGGIVHDAAQSKNYEESI